MPSRRRTGVVFSALLAAVLGVVAMSQVGCGDSDLSNSYQLFVVKRDGSELRQISRNERGPVFSPPAHPARFEQSPGDRLTLVWQVRPGSQAKQRIGGFIDGDFVSWSPDSRQLLVGATTVIGDRRNHLYTVPAAGGELRQITGEVQTGPAAWSPDGRWIAAATYDGDIELVRPDGSDHQTLVHLSGAEFRSLAWSADGSRLTFKARQTPVET